MVALTVAALPIAARAALPIGIRENPDPDAAGTPAYLILDNTTISVGSLAVAVAMAVVVVGVGARNSRHRAALATLAETLTCLLSTVAMFYVAVPVQCYTNVSHLDPAPTNCLHAPDLGAPVLCG